MIVFYLTKTDYDICIIRFCRYWVQPSINLFPGGALPEISPIGLEDPMLWKDDKDVYHAILDNGLFHAWSEDGVQWQLSPHMSALDAFGALPCKDGFEGRPHVVLGDDGITPIAITGSCYSGRPVPFGGATFTALIPIDP